MTDNTKFYITSKRMTHNVSWRVVLMVWGVMLLWQLDYVIDLATEWLPKLAVL